MLWWGDLSAYRCSSQSEDYDKLSQFIEKAGEPKFVNPRKSTDTYMGVMYVRKCLKDCKKALNNH